MSDLLSERKFQISGMTCSGCATKVENALRATEGIIDVKVSLSKSHAEVKYDPALITVKSITGVIESAGYGAKEDFNRVANPGYLARISGTAVVLLAAYFLMSKLGVLDTFNSFPLAKEGMSYGTLFVIGLLTSVHCLAMCGGINLAQTLTAVDEGGGNSGIRSALTPSFLYNAGRVISYTLIGGAVGAVGSAFSPSGHIKGLIQLLAAAFMVLMGLGMLNILPPISSFMPKLPSSLALRIFQKGRGKGPFVVGLLNGLMPCGPLQAMQLFALSTGNPISGAASMLAFSLGTVPMMFGLGALNSLINRKTANRMVTVSAVLVVLLGVLMFGNGLSLYGVSASTKIPEKPAGTLAVIKDGVQVVTTDLESSRYEPIVVQKGIPVKWVIRAQSSAINGCNNKMVIPSLNKEKRFVTGDNIVEFTPAQSGVIPFSCWMGMIRSRITVVDDIGIYGLPAPQQGSWII